MERDPQERVERFMQLLLAYQGRLYQYVRTAMPRSQDVDDVLQETFLVMWQKFDESCPAEGFYPWACRIAHLKVLKSFARKGRDVPGLNPQVLEQITADEMSEPEFLADSKLILQACLDKLSPSDRKLIEWRYEPNMRVDAIAVKLGRPVNSVSKSLGRIRQALWRCVDDAQRSRVGENKARRAP
jgi:RNA polymerase sigma-70 factor, ECF subfamily